MELRFSIHARAASVIGATLWASAFFSSVHADSLSEAAARDQSIRLYQRIAGVPPTSTLLPSLIAAMRAGDPVPTVFAAMDEHSFYKTTLIRAFSPFSNTTGRIDERPTDYNTTLVGIVRNNEDFREALYGDVLYTAEPSLSTYSVSIVPPLANADDTVDRCPLNLRTRARPQSAADRVLSDLTWRRAPEDTAGEGAQAFQPHLDGYSIEAADNGFRPSLPEFSALDEFGVIRSIPAYAGQMRGPEAPWFRERSAGNNNENNPQLTWGVCHRWTEQVSKPPALGSVRPLGRQEQDGRSYRLEEGDILHYVDLYRISDWPAKLQRIRQTDFLSLTRSIQNGSFDTPQGSSGWIEDVAGLFTTLIGGRAYFEGGTNRRSISLTFQNWLGYSMEQLHDPNVPGQYVRQDLIANATCAGCHNKMDAMANAANHLDYVGGEEGFMRFRPEFPSSGSNEDKLFRGCVNPTAPSCVNPNAFNPRLLQLADRNKWWNLATVGRNSFLGWRLPPGLSSFTEGEGLNSLMRVLAHTEAFSQRMAHLAFQTICLRESTPAEDQKLTEIAREFEMGFSAFQAQQASIPYNLRGLFAAVSRTCFGKGDNR
jgi:hypothetical protein